MRLSDARLQQEHEMEGITPFDPTEERDSKAAWFRMAGVSALEVEPLEVRGEVTVLEAVPPWEREVLLAMIDELAPLLVTRGGSRG